MGKIPGLTLPDGFSLDVDTREEDSLAEAQAIIDRQRATAPQLTAAPQRNIMEQISDFVSKPFSKSPERRIAESMNITAISKTYDIPLEQVKDNYNELIKDPRINPFPQDPNALEVASIALLPVIGAALIQAPLITVASIGAFALLDKAIDLNDFVPSDANDETKSFVELIDFVAKGAAVGIIAKGGSRGIGMVVNKFARTKATELKLPKNFKLTAEQVKDIFQTGKLTSAEEKSLFGLIGEGKTPAERRGLIKEALKKGTSINVKGEEIIALRDKPGWTKFKEALKIKEAAERFPKDPLLAELARKEKVLSFREITGSEFAAGPHEQNIAGLLPKPVIAPSGFSVDPIPDEILPKVKIEKPVLAKPAPGDFVEGENVSAIGGLKLPLLPEPPPGYKPRTNAPKVIESLAQAAKAFGEEIPIRVGRIPPRAKALGQFNTRTHVIRIRTANDITTATHEIGHSIEDRFLKTVKESKDQRGINEELIRMGRALYGANEPHNGYASEGVAEFLRLWVTRKDIVAQEAPLTTKLFEGEFFKQNPKGAKAITKTREVTEVFKTQGALNRAKQSIVKTGSLKERSKVALAKTKGFFTKRQHLDVLDPIFEFSKEAQAKLGGKLKPEDDPGFVANALRFTADARIRVMVEDYMIDVSGNPIGSPLNDIVGLVKGRRSDFTAYLLANRAKAIWSTNRNPGLALEDAEQIISELDSPAFQIAAQKFYEWNEGVLNYLSEASPSFAATIKKIREKDPGYYIPLQRSFDEFTTAWNKSATPNAGTASIGARLKGSGRNIKDPIAETIANAARKIQAAHDRMVLDRIIDLSRLPGMGKFVERVPINQVPALTKELNELIKIVTREIAKATGEAVPELEDIDLFGEVVTLFTAAQRPTGVDGPILPVWDNGKVKWFRMDPGLYDAMQGMDASYMRQVFKMPLLDWMFAKPAKIFRAGTTGLRATFGLITNPTRDVQTLWVNSDANVNGLHLLGGWMQANVGNAFGFLTGKRGAYQDVFRRLGGEMAQPLGPDSSQVDRAVREIFQGRVVKTLDPRNWVDWYRDLVQLPESSPRIAELKLKAKELGWEPGKPMSLSQSLQLLLASKQVTTDFTAAGEFSRLMNQVIPFYNAAIQGPRANVRAAKRNPGRFVMRGLGITAATLTLWWANKDKEWYKQLNAREKNMFWFIETKIGEEDVLVRIPRGFEVGQVFGSMPEAFMDATYNQQPELVEEWFETFLESSTPSPLDPPLVKVALEQARNRSFFWDRPIVSFGLEQRPEEEQFDEYTSLLSIRLGDMFNVSPKRIDHGIRGLFGSVAGDILQVTGLGPEGVDRDSEAADLLLIGTLFRRGGTAGSTSKSITALYDAVEVARKKQHSVKTPETPKQKQLRLMMTDATRAVSALYYVRSQTKEIRKRAKLVMWASDIAKDALEQVKKGVVDRGRFKKLKKDAEAKRKAIELRINKK